MHNLNFNLLKALEALLTEQHVSRAGKKIGITQSAMSIALKQLREIYQDELLIRNVHGKMQLTLFAKKLTPSVQEALKQIDAVFLGHIPFDPLTATRTFHIGMNDYIAFVLLPKLMQSIMQEAPHVKIVQHAINYLDSAKPFEETKLDIVLGNFPHVPGSLKTTHLFSDKGIIVADKHHPAFKKEKLTTKELLIYPQVFAAIESQPEENFIVKMLQDMGHDVKVSLITPHTLIALQALPGTLLMTNTVEKLARPFIKPLGLAWRPVPYKLTDYHAKMYWHAQNHNDPAHIWLRNLIKQLSKKC